MKRAFTVIASSLAAVSVAAICWGGGARTEGARAARVEPQILVQENTADQEPGGEAGMTTGEERADGDLQEDERKPDVGGPPTTEPHYGTPPLGGPDGGILEAIPDRDEPEKGDAGR